MAVKRYVASRDTTITNAFKPGLILRGTGSNMGEADSMEIFSIYGQAARTSRELSRALVQFPVSTIISERAAGTIPASGSVDFKLKLYNAKHPFTLPRKFYLKVQAVSSSWSEGWGMDCDEYSDDGYANWEVASSSSAGTSSWTADGGDYHTSPAYSAYFDRGHEDLELNVTPLVEEWIAGTKANYGLGVFLSSSHENALSSSYTKKFFARGSEYFFQRPVIEAQWDSSIRDNRASFWSSSSLAPASDNLNTIYLYNIVRGSYTNIPGVGTGSIYLQIWDEKSAGTQLTSTPITGGYYSTGIYTASFALQTTESYVYDRWFSAGLTTTYHTGSIKVNKLVGSNINANPQYLISMPNLKGSYTQAETARFRLFVRQRNWCPTVYTKVVAESEGEIVENVYYRVSRVPDELTVIDYGTGSLNHTRMSYDVSGSYFDLDISLLQPGYMYQVSYLFNLNDNYKEQEETFRFRVD